MESNDQILIQKFQKHRGIVENVEEKLKELRKMDGQISEERFLTQQNEYTEILKEIRPQFEELQREINSKLKKYTIELEEIHKKKEPVEKEIEQEKKIYKVGAISKKQYIETIKPLEIKLRELKSSYKAKTNKINSLKNAIRKKSVLKPKSSKPPLNEKPDPHAPGIRALLIEDIGSLLKKNNILANIFSQTNNYLQRFLAFIVLSQLLYLALFIIIRLEIYFGISLAWPGLTFLIFFVVAIFLVFIFLFVGERSKAGTYFGAGLIYLFVSLYLAFIMGTFNWYEIGYLSFLGTWGFWNLTLSVIILGIGIVRTFILGIGADYKLKSG